MSEAAKVRVVRCPKCENLLPEVEDFSLYQCGGCGAVLKAKNKGVDLDTSSEKSDTERIEVIAEKIVNASEKRTIEITENSVTDASSSISSSSQAERRRISRHRDGNISDYESDSIRGKGSSEHQRGNNIARNFEDLSVDVEKYNGLRRSGHLTDEKIAENVMRYSMDGSSRHDYVYENRVRNMNGNNNSGFNTFEYLGDDRVEALRKLDELKEQLSRSGNLIDKGKEKMPLDPNMMYPNFRRPPYQNHYADSYPNTNTQEMVGNRFYTSRHEYDPNHVQGFVDPLRSHSVRRRPLHQDYDPYRVVPYADDGVPYMDKMKPYPPNFSHPHPPHHPLCSCHLCLDYRQAPPTAYRDRYTYIPSEKMFSYHENPGSFGSRDYDLKLNRNGVSHTRWPSDANSEVDGFINRRTQRAHLASSKVQKPLQHQRPVACGAPFLTCFNCFELLVLPKRVEAKGINGKGKIRCGACSTVISFAHSKESSSIVFSKMELKDSLGNRRTSSDDYDSSDYGTGDKFNEMSNRNSTSTCTSEVEEGSGENFKAAVHKKEFKSTEDSRPPAGSPLQEHFEYSNKYHKVSRGGEGNRSGRFEHDNVSLPKNKPALRHKQDSSATEIDLSSNEYTNGGSTFDSGGTSGEGEKLKQGGRSADSFLAGFLKRSVRDSNNKTGEAPKQEKANVTVNGHLISDASVEKAEKLAGPIRPGNYWYDFRAGFWGVMGGPCLGIIPPFIKEFNYPMAEDCAGGNTQVFVNGRELNQKDLKLLSSRGLPYESQRSYIIEISGRVLDEDSGEELESLGKLAPTVEKAKRGFGMKAPKASA